MKTLELTQFFSIVRCFLTPKVSSISRKSIGSQYGVRHVQCFMAFWLQAIAYSLRFNLSVAIISMTDKTGSRKYVPILPWTESMKNVVMSSFLWGFPLLQIPAGMMVEKFGPKILLIVSVFVCGALAVLTPFAAIIDGADFYLIVCIRFLQGLSQGFLFPATNFLLSRWTPVSERGRLVNFAYSGSRMGMFLTMAISGLLADCRWGWPSVFYVTGGIAILWALAFCYLGADSPQLHKTISASERDYILSSLPNTSFERNTMKTPWKAIWLSAPVWALIAMHCGNAWGTNTIALETPIYINGVFGFNVQESGFLSAIPHIVSFFLGFVFAAINDMLLNRKILSKTTIRKLWNSVNNLGGALALIVLAFAGKNDVLAVSALAVIVIVNSAINLSIFTNPIDLAPNFVGILMGIATGMSCSCGCLTMLVYGFIITDPASTFQWQLVFLLSAVVFLITNLIFMIFGTAEIQPWNEPTKKRDPVA